MVYSTDNDRDISKSRDNRFTPGTVQPEVGLTLDVGGTSVDEL